MNKQTLLFAALLSVSALQINAMDAGSSVPSSDAGSSVPCVNTSNIVRRGLTRVRRAVSLENVKALPGNIVTGVCSASRCAWNRFMWAPNQLRNISDVELKAPSIAKKVVALAVVAAYAAGIYYVVKTCCSQAGVTETNSDDAEATKGYCFESDYCTEDMM